jgi:hypothetical protein
MCICIYKNITNTSSGKSHKHLKSKITSTVQNYQTRKRWKNFLFRDADRFHASVIYPRFRKKGSIGTKIIHFGRLYLWPNLPIPLTLPSVAMMEFFLFVVSLLVFLIFTSFDVSNPTDPRR